MAETQRPEHSARSGLDHENGPSRGVPRVYVLCLYPPALLTAIAGNQPAVAVGIFKKNAPRVFDFMSAFFFSIIPGS